MYVYAQVGVSLPHYTGAQWDMGVAGLARPLQAGDLVFFDGLGHVGIYIGGGQFIHAPHTGDVVKISSMSGVVLLDVHGRAPALAAAGFRIRCAAEPRTAKTP